MLGMCLLGITQWPIVAAAVCGSDAAFTQWAGLLAAAGNKHHH